MHLQNHMFVRQLAAGGILIWAFGSSCLAGTSDFVGTWTNSDPNAGSIAYVTIAQAPSGLILSVFGKCHPTACPWGPAQARVYTQRVGENPMSGATAITGSYDKGFSATEVVLELQGGTKLRYEMFTHFKDNSKRSDYFSEGILSR
jgi:hypothetical protein